MATQNDFLARLGMLAKACEFHMTADWVRLYDRALSRFGYDKATAAVEDAIIERRGRDGMPSIGDLVQRCAPQVSDTDVALEVSGRIVAAVSKLGRYAGDTDVRNWVGEVGWYVIQNNGGWGAICRTLGTSIDPREVSMWKAQLRDQAGAAVRRHKAGLLGIAPKFGEIASANQQRVSALVGQVLKPRQEQHGSAGNDRRLSGEPQHRKLDAENGS